MEAANQAFLDACLAIFSGQPAQGIDGSSPLFETALADTGAEAHFNTEAEQILGDPIKIEFPKDVFKAADAKSGETGPLAAIKVELENAGHDLDYDFKLEDYLPRIIEYLAARHGLNRAALESEAARMLGQPDPHAGTGQPAPTVQPTAGTVPPTAGAQPAQPQLQGALPGAANPNAPQQSINPAQQGIVGNQPAKKPPVPPGTPSASSLLSRLRPMRHPAPDTGTLRADPAWQRQWVLGLTEYGQGREGMLKDRIRRIRYGEVEPRCSNFVRIQILADLTSILTGNIDPDL